MLHSICRFYLVLNGWVEAMFYSSSRKVKTKTCFIFHYPLTTVYIIPILIYSATSDFSLRCLSGFIPASLANLDLNGMNSIKTFSFIFVFIKLLQNY